MNQSDFKYLIIFGSESIDFWWHIGGICYNVWYVETGNTERKQTTTRSVWSIRSRRARFFVNYFRFFINVYHHIHVYFYFQKVFITLKTTLDNYLRTFKRHFTRKWTSNMWGSSSSMNVAEPPFAFFCSVLNALNSTLNAMISTLMHDLPFIRLNQS